MLLFASDHIGCARALHNQVPAAAQTAPESMAIACEFLSRQLGIFDLSESLRRRIGIHI